MLHAWNYCSALAFIYVPPLLLPSYINQAHTSKHIDTTLYTQIPKGCLSKGVLLQTDKGFNNQHADGAGWSWMQPLCVQIPPVHTYVRIGCGM